MSKSYERIILGFLLGGFIGTFIGFSSDYHWVYNINHIRLNSDIFMNQYLGLFFLLFIGFFMYGIYRFSILCLPKKGESNQTTQRTSPCEVTGRK